MSVAITNEMRAHSRETLGSRRYLRDGLGMKTGTEEGVWMRECAGAGGFAERARKHRKEGIQETV